MKKFLSVILSLMMAISCFAVAPGVAMADNTILTPYSIALNQTLSVTFNCVLDEYGYRDTYDDEFYYTYTPTESDYYQLTITNYYVDYSDISGSTSSDTYIRISDSNDSYINSGSVNVLKNTCLTAAYLEAGQKYYFKITCYGAYDTKAPYSSIYSPTFTYKA
ncbi:MAG: hypothetical protein LUG95_03850 [Clostridiales bacterium]|nr:hypothetical protein [Clostridiales bacterium]